MKSALEGGKAFTETESRKLWEKKKVVDSVIHPDTNEVVPSE